MGLGISSVGLVIIAAAPVVAVALIGAAVAGSGFLIVVTSTNTELQRGVPEQLRGRIMALWSVAFLGCRPLAAGADGLIADLVAVRVALATAAAVACVGSAALWRTRPTGDDIDSSL